MSISPSTFVTFIRRTPELVMSNVINIWYFFLLYVSVLVFRLYRSALHKYTVDGHSYCRASHGNKLESVRQYTYDVGLSHCSGCVDIRHNTHTAVKPLCASEWRSEKRTSEKTRKRERKTSLKWDNVDFSGAHVYFCYSVPTNRLEHAQFDSSFMCILCNFLVLTVSNDSE